MDSLFLDLLRVLERQRETLKEMLDCAGEHNNALRINDIDAIKVITIREEGIIAGLKMQDQQREKLQTAIEKAFELPEASPFREMLPHAPESLAGSLDLLASEIRKIASKIAGLVDLNSILTRQAMHFNQQLLRLLLPGQNNTYRSSGEAAAPSKNASALVNKTI